MFLRLYDVNRSTIQFHKKLLPAQENRTSVFKQIRSWVGFFSSVVNCLTNPFSQKNAIEFFTLVLTNINRILQADPDLAMYNMQGTLLTDRETPIIRNSGVISNLASTIEKFNNDTASLKIKNSIGSITQKMSNA